MPSPVNSGAGIMLGTVAHTGAGMVLMHMLGEPRTMQDDPRYDDVVAEIHEYLRERVEAALFAGIAPEQLAVAGRPARRRAFDGILTRPQEPQPALRTRRSSQCRSYAIPRISIPG